MDPVRVLVVDDQRPFRLAAAAVLARTPGFLLVGEAGSGEEAVAVVATLHPDLVLLDVRLPGISGVEAAARIAEQEPRTVVVLCSSYARADLPFPLDGPGVAAYLHKEELRPSTLRAVWEASLSSP